MSILFDMPGHVMACNAATRIYANSFFEFLLSTPHRTNWLRIQIEYVIGNGECVFFCFYYSCRALLKCYLLLLSLSLSFSLTLMCVCECLYSFKNCVISVTKNSVWYNSFVFNIADFCMCNCNALHHRLSKVPAWKLQILVLVNCKWRRRRRI